MKTLRVSIVFESTYNIDDSSTSHLMLLLRPSLSGTVIVFHSRTKARFKVKVIQDMGMVFTQGSLVSSVTPGYCSAEED